MRPGSRYLALGDSVPFGYIEPNATTKSHYKKPTKITGYPEDVAANLGLKLTNAACPGETTSSFIDTTAQSNGCENTYPTGGVGYRQAHPLHATYKNKKQSQLAFATAYLKKHAKTSLITVMLGANDGFICQESTSDGCLSEFSTLLDGISKNVTKIFKTIRKKDGYTGQLILVNYYSTDYNDPEANIESQQLDMTLANAGKPYDVRVADSYSQFEKAAEQAGGDTCAAQLLTMLTGDEAGTCGVHPSLAGHALLAQAVEQAIKK